MMHIISQLISSLQLVLVGGCTLVSCPNTHTYQCKSLSVSLLVAVHSSVKNRMGIKAKLLLLVALMVGTVSVRAQKTTKQSTTQPPTETPTCQPITGNTCQVLQGPPGPPGTCSYTEVSLVKGVRDISTSLKESMKKMTDELMNSLGQIELAVTQCNTEGPPRPCSLGLSSYKPAKSYREIFQCNSSLAPPAFFWAGLLL